MGVYAHVVLRQEARKRKNTKRLNFSRRPADLVLFKTNMISIAKYEIEYNKEEKVFT